MGLTLLTRDRSGRGEDCPAAPPAYAMTHCGRTPSRDAPAHGCGILEQPVVGTELPAQALHQPQVSANSGTKKAATAHAQSSLGLEPGWEHRTHFWFPRLCLAPSILPSALCTGFSFSQSCNHERGTSLLEPALPLVCGECNPIQKPPCHSPQGMGSCLPRRTWDLQTI